MGDSRNNADAGGEATGPLYICAFCHAPFRLPAEVPLSIRYVGRTPEVECPDCNRKSDDVVGPALG